MALKYIAADTIAFVVYGIIIGGIVTLVSEVWILDVKIEQFWKVRLLYILLAVPGARICGKLTNQLRAFLLGTSEHIVRKSIAEGLSLSLYKIPIYILCAIIFQVSGRQIGAASLMFLIWSMATGWIYGWILDRARLLLAPSPESKVPQAAYEKIS
ncbi:MAG: hypothetical protein G01um101420_713 [Parcubacteria group bacterium Gr01-1014_20]|nr:MAG: hypothetical protein G01um101420_713 [Parcubacteria group bacterium Gr01-1014_20]